MGRKNILLIFTLVLILVFSCKSGPDSGKAGSRERTDSFDPTRVSQAYYNATMEEVQQFIESLNQIIRSRNFNAWKASLSPEYFAKFHRRKILGEYRHSLR